MDIKLLEEFMRRLSFMNYEFGIWDPAGAKHATIGLDDQKYQKYFYRLMKKICPGSHRELLAREPDRIIWCWEELVEMSKTYAKERWEWI